MLILIYITLSLSLVGEIFGGNILRYDVDNNSTLFPVNIIHINDMHARFEETNVNSGTCKEGEKCIGGYARLVTTIKKLKQQNQHLNPIYLNAGDNFQGTIWYNIFRWNVTQYFLNLLPADAMTIGNHEFDNGIEGVIPFMENIKSPIVITNVDDSEEIVFQNKYTNSIVIERSGRKIGIIGVILSTTNIIAQTGNLKFKRESDAVKEEATKLKNAGINIIIVLSHCGLEVDKKIAQYGGTDISIIVGGHSHSFLFTGPNPPGNDRPQDNYPVEIVQKSGHKVLIVQASAYLKYVGNITLFFDSTGKVQDFQGSPIYLDSDIEEDHEILEALKPWKEEVHQQGRREIGRTNLKLTNRNCYTNECSLGSFVADAFADIYKESAKGDWAYTTIALVNAGSLRADINIGKISYADLIGAVPFENNLGIFELQGKHLREALEHSARKPNLFQISGIKVTYNMTNPEYERITELKVLCRICDNFGIPVYSNVVDDEWYRLVMVTYITNSKEMFPMIHFNMRNSSVGKLDIDALTSYVENNNPIEAIFPKNRITILK